LRYSEIDSAQRVAVSLAMEGAAEGLAVLTTVQTHGEVPAEKEWISPEGGIYLSVVVHPDLLGIHLLSLTTGLEIAKVLSSRTTTPLKLKWPGDIIVEGDGGKIRKLAAVHTDVVSMTGFLPVVVVGIDMNAQRAPLPAEIAPRAIFLEDLSTSPVKAKELEEPLIEAVLRAGRRVSMEEERAHLGSEIGGLLWGTGHNASIDGKKGILKGVGAAGEVILATDKGEEAFWTGNLRVEDA
jgi:biotin-[acetyl-CoA-carboxylase] ligase BirA-like protein